MGTDAGADLDVDACSVETGNTHIVPAPAATIVPNSAIAMIREKDWTTIRFL
jgi:hypothetical protein